MEGVTYCPNPQDTCRNEPRWESSRLGTTDEGRKNKSAMDMILYENLHNLTVYQELWICDNTFHEDTLKLLSKAFSPSLYIIKSSCH